MTLAFLWALAATFAAGIQVFSQRIVAQHRRDSALNGVLGFGIAAAITGFFFLLAPEVPTHWKTIIGISFSAGIMLCFSSYYRIESLKNIDSVVYFPINKVLGPLIAVVVGLSFLHERVSLIQLLGIGFSILVPILLIPSERHRQNNLQKGLTFLCISTILAALTAPMQKVVTNLSSEVLFPLLAWQIAATIGSALLYLYLKRNDASRLIVHKRDIELGLLNGILQFFSAYAFIKAVSLGQVSIFYVIHAHYILIPIVLSVLFFGDHINLKKVAAIAVSFCAIILLAL